MATSNQPASQQTTDAETTSVFGLLLRVFWMFAGNIAMAVSVLMILNSRDTMFSVADIVYGASVPLMIGARYLDITRFKGATAYGDPATVAHWWRYAITLLAGSIVVWCAAHGIAHVMAR